VSVKIARDTVLHVAALARLNLSEAEVETYMRQLNAILEYMDQLAQLDTSAVEPTEHVIPLETPFRDDRVNPSLDPEESLRNAPERDGNFFKVPKIL
jgi:aspartyl-tRNA(Asn)/glutamyl-tRNA(Gln) amidotransferase subunit C